MTTCSRVMTNSVCHDKCLFVIANRLFGMTELVVVRHLPPNPATHRPPKSHEEKNYSIWHPRIEEFRLYLV